MLMAVLKWRGKQVTDATLRAGAFALQLCAEDLRDKSTQEAPIHLGDLRTNCSVSPPKMTAKSISLTVGYDLPYALKQHEHMEYRHPMGGKAKYLEDPFNANKDKYKAFIAKAIGQELS